MAKVTREEVTEEVLQQYAKLGKLPDYNRPSTSTLQVICETFMMALIIIGLIIKHNLARIIPALRKPKLDFRGKVVLLTGAAGGFGRRVAEALAVRGAKIACVDVDAAANERCVAGANAAAAAAGLSTAEPAAYAFRANLVKREEAYGVVRTVEEKFGRVDVLITAAVSFTNYHVEGYDDDEIDFLVDLNFKCCLWMLRAVLPGMKKRNSGHVAVFSSISACGPSPGLSLYSACKAAVAALMNTVYQEILEENLDIGVTVIYPTFSKTNPLVRELIRSRLSFVDPDDATDEIIQAIEARQVNAFIPRSVSYLGGHYGLLPQEVIDLLVRWADVRMLNGGICPKATVTVDQWTKVYGAFRGPSGAFVTSHDDAQVTPEMIEKGSVLLRTVQEKLKEGRNVKEAVQEVTAIANGAVISEDEKKNC